MLRPVSAVTGAILLCALLISYFGSLHPIADSLAVFRPGLAVVLILTMLPVLRWRLLAWPAFAIGTVSLALRALALLPAADGPVDIVLYQKNLLFRLADPAPILADINASAPDVVALQEVSENNRGILEALTETHPYQHFCPFGRVGGTAILSRFEFTDVEALCLAEDGLAAAQVNHPKQPLWVVSLHLHWPWPHRQAAQVERFVPLLEKLDHPVIVAGDFNMVPWSHSVRQIASATGTGPIGPVLPTYHFAGQSLGLGISIDHVLAPAGGTLTRRPGLGSDHMGLLAGVALP